MAEIKRNTRQFVMPVSKWETVVREGDGFIDDIFDRKGAKFGELIPEWLAYHVVSMGTIEKCNKEHVLDLLVQDQESLMLEIYQCNQMTSIVNLRVACEHCYEPNGISVDIANMSFRPPPESYNPENKTFKTALPRSGWDVEWEYITGRQELLAVERMERGVFDSLAVLFESLIQLGPYRRGIDLKYRHVKELLTLDRTTLRKALEEKSCGYDTRYRWKCKYCDKPNITNILGQIGFFRVSV